MSDELAHVGDTSGDEFLDVTFYQKIVEGQEVDFINIKVPGDKTLEIDEQVTDNYSRRFSRKYNQFKSMQTMTGTPIDTWDDIPEGLKREFAYLGFRYVEQVAGAPDSAFARIMGGHQWRHKAQAFMNRGKISADVVIQKQQKQIEELQLQMAVFMEQTAPKRGRPAKTEEIAESAE